MLPLIVAVSVVAAAPAHELSLAPAVEYLPKFTHHEGTQLRYSYVVSPGVSVFAQWREHWSSGVTSFSRDLTRNFREAPEPAVEVLLRRAIIGGAALQPFQADLYSGKTLSFGLAVGAGVGDTAFELRPTGLEPMLGRVGPRLTGYGALEFELRLNDHLAVSASFDDLFFPAYVDAINGCTAGDLSEPEITARAGRSGPSAWVSDDCDLSSFPTPRHRGSASALLDQGPVGSSLRRAPSTEIRHVRSVALGLAVTF